MTPTTCAAIQTPGDCAHNRPTEGGSGAGVGLGIILAVVAVVMFVRSWRSLA